jgi:very-short-patch-repair endonuclease
MPARTPLPPEFDDRAFRVTEARAVGVLWQRLSASDLDAPTHGARVPVGGSMLDALAAVMTPDQAFTGPTAARLWRIPLPRLVEADERVWVSTFGRDRSMRRDGVVARRRTHGAVLRVDGYPVLDPARTWCSLAGVLATHDLVAAGDRIVTTSPRLPALADAAALELTLRTIRRGRRQLEDALREVRCGAWSRPESLLRIALVEAGLPEPALNVPVRVGRRVAVPDLAWSEFRVAVEYDGAWHDDRSQRLADLERHELLADEGWLVVRIRAAELFPEPLIAVARILRRLTSRGYHHVGSIERAGLTRWLP